MSESVGKFEFLKTALCCKETDVWLFLILAAPNSLSGSCFWIIGITHNARIVFTLNKFHFNKFVTESRELNPRQSSSPFSQCHCLGSIWRADSHGRSQIIISNPHLQSISLIFELNLKTFSINCIILGRRY